MHTIPLEDTKELKQRDRTVKQEEKAPVSKMHRTKGNLNMREVVLINYEILATILEEEAVVYISSIGDQSVI